MHALGLLETLLEDKTTRGNILWASDAYRALGDAYRRDREMRPEQITGAHSGVIKSRARRELEQQSARSTRRADACTPLRVCAKMIDEADTAWFGEADLFRRNGEPTPRVVFPLGQRWESYVDARWMEITCGEAPYLVSRYDAVSGEAIPPERRIGILDRKLRAVNENTASEAEWLRWAMRALQATYGYELQGDNLLIARLNLLMTFEEYLSARWRRKPTPREYRAAANIIAWNLWQMDGLTGMPPYARAAESYRQLSFADLLGAEAAEPSTLPPCKIYNWRGDRGIAFSDLPVGERHAMKFDFIIGTPPLQEESPDARGDAAAIYPSFADAAYALADKVLLITPAQVLSRAGYSPGERSETMSRDAHLKVLFYEPDSAKLFPGIDLEGGVAITLHDKDKASGAGN